MAETTTDYTLEWQRLEDGFWCRWWPAEMQILEAARHAADSGDCQKAIELAEAAWLEEYGNMDDVRFRVVRCDVTIEAKSQT